MDSQPRSVLAAAGYISRPSFPYGHAPLDLPSSWPELRRRSSPGGSWALLAPAWLQETGQLLDPGRSRSLEQTGFPDQARLPVATDPERLFWFRWITGHQLIFFGWRALELILEDVRRGIAAGSTAEPAPVEWAIELLQFYSATFIYTATCPRSLYEAHIRPWMRLAHASFSGSWAREWQPLLALLSWVTGRAHGSSDEVLRRLRNAIRNNAYVHMAVARKLVPDGESVQEHFRASGRGDDTPEADRHYFYDAFFFVRRGDPTPETLLAQLKLRAELVLADLAANGLYPRQWNSIGEYERTDRDRDLLLRLEQDLPGLVSRGVDIAASALVPEVTVNSAPVCVEHSEPSWGAREDPACLADRCPLE